MSCTIDSDCLDGASDTSTPVCVRLAAAPVARAIRIAASTVLLRSARSTALSMAPLTVLPRMGAPIDGSGTGTVTGGGNGSTDDGIVNMAGSGDELTGGSGGTGTSGGAGAAPEGPSVGECVACMVASDCTALYGPAQEGYQYACQANACASVDVNECALGTDECDANASCSNTTGGYDCTCNDGYTGDGRDCIDANECTAGTDNCDANATCVNITGGFSCVCNDGYTGSGTSCSDVNECTLGTDNCHANASCTNTVGSLTCACNNGYSGSGTSCSDVDECFEDTHNCPSGTHCFNTIGSFTCEGCLTDTHCSDVDESYPVCVGGNCNGCTSDSDCSINSSLKVCTVDGSVDGSIDGSSTDGSTDGSGTGTVTGGGNGSTDDGIVNMAGSGDELDGRLGGQGMGGAPGDRKVLRLVKCVPAWWLPIARLCTARRKKGTNMRVRQMLAPR